jgi:hypothetical protein
VRGRRGDVVCPIPSQLDVFEGGLGADFSIVGIRECSRTLADGEVVLEGEIGGDVYFERHDE